MPIVATFMLGLHMCRALHFRDPQARRKAGFSFDISPEPSDTPLTTL
jgi:hypothetical protein